MAAAPTDLNTVYATARGGHVFVTTNHGTNWVERDPVAPNANLRFKGLFVDPTDANIAYVVATSFDDVTGDGHVWRTTNAGVSWTNISGNLPDIPTWSIVVDDYGPGHANDIYYVGADDGVYVSLNQGTTWTHLGFGLPHAQVVELDRSTNLGILAAGTHGRGLWELAIPPMVTPPPNQTAAEGAPTPFSLGSFVDLAGGPWNVDVDWGDGTATYDLQHHDHRIARYADSHLW